MRHWPVYHIVYSNKIDDKGARLSSKTESIHVICDFAIYLHRPSLSPSICDNGVEQKRNFTLFGLGPKRQNENNKRARRVGNSHRAFGGAGARLTRGGLFPICNRGQANNWMASAMVMKMCSAVRRQKHLICASMDSCLASFTDRCK